MTANGIDFSFDRPDGNNYKAIKAAGYQFIVRYYGGSASKDLTKTEALLAAQAGLLVVGNFEGSATSAKGGKPAGVRDAQQALNMANSVGQPSNTPIYFSVDWDATETDQVPINGYFDGVASVIGLARTGGYGGYWPISRAFDAGKIKWGWQTYAWSGTNWESRCQMRQVQNGIVVAGADSDKDVAEVANYGGWVPVGFTSTPVKPNPAPKPPAVNHAPGSRNLKDTSPDMMGDDVLFVQHFIGPKQCGKADGDFGPNTARGVKWYQGMRGIKVDGIVGPQTWSNMGVKYTG